MGFVRSKAPAQRAQRRHGQRQQQQHGGGSAEAKKNFPPEGEHLARAAYGKQCEEGFKNGVVHRLGHVPEGNYTH
ncbi:hypothetical protein SDC9_89360 [bioreactor metagenome]|uniref:Uncharacterized protein n=1 Tax=bioreactor metagenome TaxID=1076179 RepID=A0A644ZS29_9ZZZZ